MRIINRKWLLIAFFRIGMHVDGMSSQIGFIGRSSWRTARAITSSVYSQHTRVHTLSFDSLFDWCARKISYIIPPAKKKPPNQINGARIRWLIHMCTRLHLFSENTFHLTTIYVFSLLTISSPSRPAIRIQTLFNRSHFELATANNNNICNLSIHIDEPRRVRKRQRQIEKKWKSSNLHWTHFGVEIIVPRLRCNQTIAILIRILSHA